MLAICAEEAIFVNRMSKVLCRVSCPVLVLNQISMFWNSTYWYVWIRDGTVWHDTVYQARFCAALI